MKTADKSDSPTERGTRAVVSKDFASTRAYASEIEMLVPGYSLMHSMVTQVAGTFAPNAARVLVVGCGRGNQAIALAEENPCWQIDAYDPEPAMVQATKSAVAKRGLEERVLVHRERPKGDDYDVVLSVLVGHFVSDDGARAQFIGELSSSLRPGGAAIFVEPVRGFHYETLTDVHVRWSATAGLGRERCNTLSTRMLTGFHALTRTRLRQLLDDAHLSAPCVFYSAFGFEGWVSRKLGSVDPSCCS